MTAVTAMTAMTTVGYGDGLPVSWEGRVIGIQLRKLTLAT